MHFILMLLYIQQQKVCSAQRNIWSNSNSVNYVCYFFNHYISVEYLLVLLRTNLHKNLFNHLVKFQIIFFPQRIYSRRSSDFI